MQVKKQQLELDMEQWTGSKLGKEYVKAVLEPPPSALKGHPHFLTSLSLLLSTYVIKSSPPR